MPFYAQRYLAGEGYRIRSTHISSGWHPKTHDELMISEVDRYSGMYVLGVPGMGKSGLLETLIHQDAGAGGEDRQKQKAIVVLDAHGDTVNNVLAAIPQHRIAQTFVLDLLDEERPYGINPFAAFKAATEVERSQASAKIEHLFEVLWAGAMDQQFLPRFVRAVTFTLLDNPGSTLVDVLTLLEDDTFRTKMVANVRDPGIRRFWEREFDEHSKAERDRRTAPLIGRLERLFLGKALVRNVVGQRRSSVNFRRAIEERQIILVPLPIKQLGDDARTVGLLLIAQLHAAIFSYADVPAEQRPGLSLYIDEFQNFTTSDIEELVTEGRKYCIRLTVAHQLRNKLPDFLKEPTAAMRTKICFQTTAEDARAMAPYFPVASESIAPEDLDPHATKHLLDYGSDDPLVRTFIDTYLRPVMLHRHGGKVEMLGAQRLGVMDAFIPGAMREDGTKPEVHAPDPLPYLDNLLYEVMRTKNALLPIPFEAIFGFANCGGGFYSATKWTRGSQDLRGDVQFPAYLANQTVNGYVWLRPPETDKERLWHAIFHMRMLMMSMAEHPLGKTSKPSATDSAYTLIHLPKRAALVRYGEGVGVIYTNNTPKRLTGEALEARKFFVREQTRQTYCHKREQIENRVLSDSATDPGTFTRWEEVESDDGTSNQSSIPGNADLRHPATGDTTNSGGTV